MALAILLALAAGGTWAIGMTVAKPALRHIDMATYMLARWILVAALALCFALASGTFFFSSVYAVGLAALAGFVDAALGGLFYLLAMQRAPAYQTTTLSSTAPVWGVASAILLLGEPLRWQVVVAAGLAVVGAFLLVGRKIRIREHFTGSALAILTGILWGYAETVPSKLALAAGLPSATLLLVFAAAGVATLLALLPILRPRIPRKVTPIGLRLTLLSGAGGAFLGWLLWLSALRVAPASVISPIRGSTLVFALVYSVIFLRERPGRWALAGAALVLGGVILVSTAA
jgi:drug/metabolite transporter (DMT)-like permease